ncbi:hypothetical protein HGA64_00230 [Candidatus Falkowbacteria bacterium]|nr:hypothetical protein [Candidatus Falkowbacteria bacterium]
MKIKIISFLLASAFLSFFSAHDAKAQTAPATQKCEPVRLEFVFRNPNGDFIPNMGVEVWTQGNDVDGKPAPLKKVASGKTDTIVGKAIVTFTPTLAASQSSGIFAFKVFDKNNDIGAFWYFNELSLGCGSQVQSTKVLSGIRLVFRDQDGNLKKNVKFSLYTQRYDIENKPINEKKDLVSSAYDTGAEGEEIAYLTDPQQTMKGVGGDYVMVANLGGDIGFVENYIHVNSQQITEYEYVFTDMLAITEDASGKLIPAGKSLEFFEQKQDVKGKFYLGKSLKKITINAKGEALFEYPFGTYAVVMKDDFGKDITFWNVMMQKYQRSRQKFITNLTRLEVFDLKGKVIKNANAQIYSVTQDYRGDYFKDKSLGNIKLTEKGYGENIIAPGKYLLSMKLNKDGKMLEYGKIFVVESGRLQKFQIKPSPELLIEFGKKLPAPGSGPLTAIAKKLKGYILLQTESKGEAWYVDTTGKRYYLADGSAAYQAMRKLGLGAKNSDLQKIPIGIRSDLGGFDTDGDGLSNTLEEAIGTDPMNSDTDGDSYQDNAELNNGFNPSGGGRLKYDTAFANKLKGKILLQTEGKGEAWYINPKDGHRYYLANGEVAYQIMRLLSLGISNANLDQINEASL